MYYKSKKDNPTMSVVKVSDIFVEFPILFHKLHRKVKRALIIELIVNHI